MEYKLQQKSHFIEVYISDIPELKKIFLETFNLETVNENFGIPFLLMKKGNYVTAFASLIIAENKIDFIIYGNTDVTKKDMGIFFKNAEKYIKQNNSGNFRDIEKLRNSIDRMVNWL
ncbi:hypothetical protein [Chryseobacterium sp. FH2]|uniref:hypothetical protein n=1 Tax=Chryseobacterium sp. FH2 TaxID=1674291 RepID=UPI00103E17C0|nr:hypothetical protein [Chryseobacterium sp. FH2]